jgi:DNA-binding beta-propeller fold protein YncE
MRLPGILFLGTSIAAALCVGSFARAQSDDKIPDNTGVAPLPSQQYLTPTFAPGSKFAVVSPTIVEYTSAVGNYPNFEPNGAIASTLSPDGTTLAVMTSGYNTLNDVNGDLLGTPKGSGITPGSEFIVLYNVTTPGSPVMIQTLRPPNTFVGLLFGANSQTLYVSGGNDDQVIVYTKSNGTWAQSAKIALNHEYTGNGIGQYPQAGGLALSGDGTKLAVANTLNDSVSVINTATNKVLFEYDLRPYNTTPSTGSGVAGGERIYGVAFMGNNTIYATSLRDREVDVFSFSGTTPSLITRIAVPGNPNNLLLNAAQTMLYVTQDNSDRVAVISTATNAVVEEIDAIAPPGTLANSSARYTGAGTNNLALSPDQSTLYVTNGGANDLAIIPLSGPAPHSVAALVPTGWYPTTVTASADGSTLYVFNNKSDPGSNPNNRTTSVTHLADYTYPGGDVGATAYSTNQYVFLLEQSGMLTLPVPATTSYASLTAQVAANNGWNVASYAADQTAMSFLHQNIQHIIYIVKENRTFDEILGDLANGSNGDPSLTVFGKRITPNLHALANNFVTLDNFFDPAEVSGNGWAWSLEGRETDWDEKTLPMDYAYGVNRANAPYDSEGQNENVSVAYVGSTPSATVAAREAEAGGFDYQGTANGLPGGALNLLPGIGDIGAADGANGGYQTGHIWDAALAAGLTVRNYGMNSDNSHYGLSSGSIGYPQPVEHPYAAGSQQCWTAAAALIPYTDIYFRGFDNSYPDTWRLEEFEREFSQFVSNGNLPNLVLLRYMHDHMGNFSTGSLGGAEASAETEQADDDFAVGMTLQLLANSPYAGNTLVFVIEDDAQDGADHMDAHRSTAYIVGPYVKQHAVVSTRYSTVNLVRTIEDILGLQHLNLNTAYQRPMTDVFNISQSPAWTYTATASTVLKSTTLTTYLSRPDHPVQFASGPDVKPLHDAKWWAEKTRGFNFKDEDRLPAQKFNRLVWAGVVGARPYPEQRTGKIQAANHARDADRRAKSVAVRTDRESSAAGRPQVPAASHRTTRDDDDDGV